jgi:Flp pilus assembly protein TadD
LLNELNTASNGSPEVTKNLQRAIELDPNYADAYGMLGIALMNKGSYAQAETNLACAMALSPRNEVYRLNYAFALLNQQKIAEAKTSLSYVSHSSNPDVAAQANRLLLQVQQYESRTSAAAPVAAPAAVLTVTSAGKTWKLKVANTEKVVVIGADKFSCSWSHIKVALNFTPTAPNEGNVITLDIQ